MVGGGRGEVLHKETGVNGDENGWAEVRQPSHEGVDIIGVIGQSGRILREGAGAGLSHGGDDAGGSVEDEEAVGQADENGGGDSSEGGKHKAEGVAQGGGEAGKGVAGGGVAGHEDGGKGWKVRGGGCRRNGVRGLVVGEDLIDRQGDIGEQQAALHHVATARADAPGAQAGGAGNRDTKQHGVMGVEPRKGGDAPQEVDGGGEDAARHQQQADHPAVAGFAGIDRVASHLARRLDHQQTAEALGELEARRGVAQQPVPSPNRHPLRHALAAPHPLAKPNRVRRIAGSATTVVDAEPVETPNQESGDHQRLHARVRPHQRPSPPRPGGGGQAQAAEHEVIPRQSQAERQPAGPPADVEGKWDGEDDADEEERTADRPEQHPRRQEMSNHARELRSATAGVGEGRERENERPVSEARRGAAEGSGGREAEGEEEWRRTQLKLIEARSCAGRVMRRVANGRHDLVSRPPTSRA